MSDRVLLAAVIGAVVYWRRKYSAGEAEFFTKKARRGGVKLEKNL